VKDFSKQLTAKKIRFYMLWSLIFLFCASCEHTGNDLVLRWQQEKAVAVALKRGSRSEPGTLRSTSIAVRLVGQKDGPSILGDVTNDGPWIVFSPLIPFTRGLTYEISVNGKLGGTFHVPKRTTETPPSVLALYPTADTVPENLLKIYIHFSHPMREWLSRKYVHLLNGNDTIRAAFLDLTPELWNEERTILTLWLDPGRIKRDLKPNLQLGAPLEASSRYHIVISPQWQNQQLTPLSSGWVKTFTTSRRDSLSPTPDNWVIATPEPGTRNAMTITFGEALDHELLLETLAVHDQKGMQLNGKWQTGIRETSVTFTPTSKWTPGIYTIKVLTKLEDLAGNNLNRPFERNMNEKTAKGIEKDFIEIPFDIGQKLR
jgi:hypothetical protein